jgi:hypothetical protein
MIRISTATITRPADTKDYAANDRISTVTGTTNTGSVFLGLGETMFGNGYVTKGKIFTNTNASGITSGLRLHLYTLASGETISTGTTVGDNANMVIVYADAPKYVGYLDFTNWVNSASGSVSVVDTARICFQRSLAPLVTVPGATGAGAPGPGIRQEFASTGTLVGILETLGAFTPASGQNFQIELMTDAYEG